MSVPGWLIDHRCRGASVGKYGQHTALMLHSVPGELASIEAIITFTELCESLSPKDARRLAHALRISANIKDKHLKKEIEPNS